MKLIKKFVFAFFFMYSFNVIAIKYEFIIPINVFTILTITFLDVPGMFFMILLLRMM